MGRLRRTVALMVVVALAGSGVAMAVDTSDAPATRFVFVARGDNPIDALAAAPVAGRLDAPVLLTRPDALSDEAAQGIVDFAPDVIVVAGGEGAVSPEVLDEIVALVPAEVAVRRVSGTSRYATAQELAGLVREYDPAFAYQPIDLSRLAEAPVPVERTYGCSPVMLAGTHPDAHVTSTFVEGDRYWAMYFSVFNASVACTPPVPIGARLTGIEMVGQDTDNDSTTGCSAHVVAHDLEEAAELGAREVASARAASGMLDSDPAWFRLEGSFETPHVLADGESVTVDCWTAQPNDLLVTVALLAEVDLVPGADG